MGKTRDDQFEALGKLVQLQRTVRQAGSLAELAFSIVNDSLKLFPYRQALLWIEEKGVQAVSGLPDVDRNSPYIQWAVQLFNNISPVAETKIITPGDLPDRCAGQWAEWLPKFALAVPLRRSSGAKPVGILLLARQEPFWESEAALIEEAAEMYGYGLHAFLQHKSLGSKLHAFFTTGKRRLAVGAAFLALLCLPVRLSILAPAELAPKEPVLVRVPISGVIKTIYVHPNDVVKKGQLLFDLDDTALKNQLEIARKAMLVADAEYKRTSQKALFDVDSKMELAVRKGLLDEKKAEVKYYADQLQRVNVTAPEDGVAVFTDVHDWLGRAVSVGESVISVADPEHIEILIHMPMADAIPLEENAPIKLFLNIAPNHPIDGEVVYTSYRAQPTSEGILAYKVKGRIGEDEKNLPRIGLAGTAKIYGKRSSLFYYIFRRPLATLRQWLGV